MPAAVNGINHSGHLMLPAAVILFSAAGTGARHGEATINRDLSFVADANARCSKRKVPVTVKQLCSSVYVIIWILKLTYDIYLVLYLNWILHNYRCIYYVRVATMFFQKDVSTADVCSSNLPSDACRAQTSIQCSPKQTRLIVLSILQTCV